MSSDVMFGLAVCPIAADGAGDTLFAPTNALPVPFAYVWDVNIGEEEGVVDNDDDDGGGWKKVGDVEMCGAGERERDASEGVGEGVGAGKP